MADTTVVLLNILILNSFFHRFSYSNLIGIHSHWITSCFRPSKMDLLKEELSSATLAALQAHLDSQKAAEKEGEDKENVLKEDFRKSQL